MMMSDPSLPNVFSPARSSCCREPIAIYGIRAFLVTVNV
jgi:hypothetical protein